MINTVSAQELDLQRRYMQLCSQRLTELFPEKQPLCFVHSYGCQGNVADGEKIKGILAEIGYGFTDDSEHADLALLNTCAIRENAEDRVFGNLGMLIHQKKRRPEMIIGLCGCMMQQKHIAERIQKHFPGANLIFGTHVMHKLPQMLFSVLAHSERVVDISDSDGVIVEDLPIVRSSSFKASIPISYGCNNFCTYCIVPYVRGRERSRSMDRILQEAQTLIENGCKEILLLGQNVNSYGKDLDEPVTFSELLRKLNDIPGDFWIRFMTSHPKDATPELIDTLAECNKVCRHLHLPVQSGSDRILKAMNRHYDIRRYLELVDYAKKKIPDLSLTSDIIVGFPGETYEDFLKTCQLIDRVEYTSLFTFIYSPREGTRAAKMYDPIRQCEKSKWLSELLQLQNKISERIHQNRVGATERILLDGVGRINNHMITGRTSSHIVVDCVGDRSRIGQFADVKILKAHRMALEGTILNERIR